LPVARRPGNPLRAAVVVGFVNPRIVKGRSGSDMAFAVRGHVAGEAFVLGGSLGCARSHERMRVEDRLLAEARALIDRAESGGGVDWDALRFRHHAEFDVWEKTLTPDELDRLMSA